LHLDFGLSLSTQEAVLNIILKSLPASLELGFFSILSATLIGFPLGLIGLSNRGKKIDYIARILGIATYAIPPFWGAMLAQLLFSVLLNISPIGGRFPIFQQQPQITGFLVLDSILSNNIIALKDSLYHLALPSITLGFLLSGIFSRSLRVNLDKTNPTSSNKALVGKKEIIFVLSSNWSFEFGSLKTSNTFPLIEPILFNNR